VATAVAVQDLLAREAAKPGAAWVSRDGASGHSEEGCQVAADALQILHQTLSQRRQPQASAANMVP
jgi:hypothetical protein